MDRRQGDQKSDCSTWQDGEYCGVKFKDGKYVKYHRSWISKRYPTSVFLKDVIYLCNRRFMPAQKISEDLLLALKTNKPYSLLVQNMAVIERQTLNNELNDDDTKKAFWINVYNSFFLILRKHKNVIKPAIYIDKLIDIAGQKMSLDDIEHGILRKYRIKKSLGYLPNWFAPSWIKKWAVDEIDFRIHFALNCGAVSCPPIAFYNSERIDYQLETATYSFLESEVKINDQEKTTQVSKLFQWYHGDFGGNPGIRKIIKKYLEKDISGYSIKYAPYDYSEHLDNFM